MSIAVDNISYKIGDKTILNAISLDLLGGEVLSILGPNGSGKSTLMKLLSGDITPDSGTIAINGKNLLNITIQQRAILRSMMSQTQNIVYDFNVKEIIEMGWVQSFSDIPYDYFKKTIDNICDECGVHHLLGRRFNSLSGGEQRMIHFARTLLQSSGLSNKLQKYIFFDEPTANLDIKKELHILKVIKNKAREGYGIFLVLHDLNLAYNFSDRIILLKDGEISKTGYPNEVFDDTILSDVYEVDISFDKNNGRAIYY